LVTSPIGGVITNKAVSVGDSVTVGQLITTISKSSNIKIQFYVDSDQRATLQRGQKISTTDTNGNSTALLIKNIAIVADPTTKRFLIEAYPEKQGSNSLLAGTITTVSIETVSKPKIAENIILPLSAISIGQNESYMYWIENNIVKKEIVNIENVNGENAEVSTILSGENLIIIDGNKLVHAGETVTVQN
jgi:RND family efflux transporter MFP subunit